MRLILSEITLSACLLLILIEGTLAQRRFFRIDRTRRQENAETELGSETPAPPNPTLRQQSIRDPKPDVPALYSLPRSDEAAVGNSPEEAELDTERLESQSTTTELSSTHLPLEDSSEPSKLLRMGAKEEESEGTEAEGPSSPTPVELGTQGPSLPSNTEPSRNLFRNSQSQSSEATGGYAGGGYVYRERSNFLPEGSPDKGKISNMIIEEMMSPLYENEIPRVYSVRPAGDQRQTENSFYRTNPGGAYRQPMEPRLENIRDFAPVRPVPNQYPSAQGGYSDSPKFEMYRHRIIEGQGQPLYSGGQINPRSEVSGIPQKSRNLISLYDMGLEGLENHIVDSELLGRVQQIIENHEREQRVFLQRYEQNQAQVPITGYPSRGGTDTGGRIQNQTPTGVYYSQQQQFPPTSQQIGIQSAAPEKNAVPSGDERQFFRASKTFPGNPNLEFQPAILTGHFVETVDEAATAKGNLTQAIPAGRDEQQQYLPPPNSNFQNFPPTPDVQNIQQQLPQLQFQPQQLPQQQFPQQPVFQQSPQQQLPQLQFPQQRLLQQQLSQQPFPQQQLLQQNLPQQPYPQQQLPQFQSPKHPLPQQLFSQQQLPQQNLPQQPYPQQQLSQFQSLQQPLPQQQFPQQQLPQQLLQPQFPQWQVFPQQQQPQGPAQQQLLQQQLPQPQLPQQQFLQQQLYQPQSAQQQLLQQPSPRQNAVDTYTPQLSNGNQQQLPNGHQQQPNPGQKSLLFEPSYVYRAPPSQQTQSSAERSGGYSEPKPEFGTRANSNLQIQKSLELNSNSGSSPSGYTNSNTGPTDHKTQNLAETPVTPYLQNNFQAGKTSTNGITRTGNFFDRTQVAPPTGTGQPLPRPEYLPPSSTSFFVSGSPTGAALAGNPNVITRTIVVHEQPTSAGNGNPDISNRAIVTEADFTSTRNSAEKNGRTVPNAGGYAASVLTENGVEGNSNPPNSNSFLRTATAQVQFGSSGNTAQANGVNRHYNAPLQQQRQQSNQPSGSDSLKNEEAEPEKPRPIYGIPIAPVLGPESLDDSVIVDAAQPSSNSVYSNAPKNGQSQAQAEQNEAAGYGRDATLTALYRLPNSDSFTGNGVAQRRRDLGYSSAYNANELHRNIQKRFSSPVPSRLAGFFTLTKKNPS